MNSTSTELLAITRLCALAKDGARPNASAGERVANQLLKAIDKIGDDLALLDREHIAAFHSLCLLAHGPWPTDFDKSVVFQTIHKAAHPTITTTTTS